MVKITKSGIKSLVQSFICYSSSAYYCFYEKYESVELSYNHGRQCCALCCVQTEFCNFKELLDKKQFNETFLNKFLQQLTPYLIVCYIVDQGSIEALFWRVWVFWQRPVHGPKMFYFLVGADRIQEFFLLEVLLLIVKKYIHTIIAWLLVNIIILKLFSQLVLYFLKLLFSKFSEQSKKRLIDVFDGAWNTFWKNMFNFFSSLAYDLIELLLSDVNDLQTSIFNYSRSNFSYLINSVSTSISKKIPV